MMIAVLIYVQLAYFSVPALDLNVFASGDYELQVIEIALTAVAAIILLLGLGWPRLINRSVRGNAESSSSDPLKMLIVRAALLESVGIYGLVLAILGAKTAITLPFFLLSLIALLLTFPTRERWRKMGGDSDDQPGPVS